MAKKDKTLYITRELGIFVGEDEFIVHANKEDAMEHIRQEVANNENKGADDFEAYKQVPLKVLRTVKVTVDVNIGKKGGKHAKG